MSNDKKSNADIIFDLIKDNSVGMGDDYRRMINCENIAEISDYIDEKLISKKPSSPIFQDNPHSLITVNQMCMKSLNPETMKKWDDVVETLIATRSDLKGVGYDKSNGNMDFT